MDPVDRIWSVARDNIGVDAEALFAAVIDPAVLTTDDPRTRLLVRDSVAGLRRFWGRSTFQQRISPLPQRPDIEAFFRNQPSDTGFPSLSKRIMNVTNPEDVMQMLRELGKRLHEPATITIGGSIALILMKLISRHTEDIDVVNELPEVIRREHGLLDEYTQRYKLKLTHFQSHYLPSGWDHRTWSAGIFDELVVRVVDSGDILIGKLFSRRTKDLDDVRSVWPKIDQQALRRRIGEDTANFRADAKSLESALHNWYVLTGEQKLP